MKYIPIAGTHAFNDAWTREDSDFGRMMASEGFELLRRGDRPYRWSTALDGIFGTDDDWAAAADALYWFLLSVPIDDRNIIAHSHAGQVVLLLAASGVPIRSLTTVGTPVRDDIPSLAAATFIEDWQHLYDLKRDFWGWIGAIGDHELRLQRTFAIPRVRNIGVPGISHSNVLRDPRFIPLWQSQGWLENIRRATPAEG